MSKGKIEKISAGSFDLNKWLYGGYEKGIITMIAGPPGSGKTNFAILTACSQAKHKEKVIFIDTEGGFSSERVRQIVGDKYEEILDNLFLLEPKSFAEQRKIFDTLLENVKKNHVGLIVVDSMAMLYRLELGDSIEAKENKTAEINREVARQMRILAEIARNENLPIIITNQTYKDFQTEEEWRSGKEPGFNIVGGDLFKYWSKCILELRNSSGKRRVILKKHRSMPEKEMDFVISDKGIFKRKWI